MKESILVTGGAGYIGSHTAHLLAHKGYNVIILDNLNYQQPSNFEWAHFIKGDVGDEKLLESIFSQFNIQAVIHFAGFIAVGESVKNPAKYYDNNVTNTLTLLKMMVKYHVRHIIFSSSAAVYGIPEKLPLREVDPKVPVNAYGNTKLIVEYMLSDFARAHDINFVALRYFNACGGDLENGLGERHDPETHIIPLALRAALYGETFNVFGNDYDTPDGTCIRDYLHVKDLASAHLAALYYLEKGESSNFFNLGTGYGYSVKEVLSMIEKIIGKSLKINICVRREGDPARLVADSNKAQKTLQWKPVYSDLRRIITDAYNFELYFQQESKSNELNL